MNKVVLIGRLTKDPELRFTAGSGIAVATFTLAVDRNFVGQSGQREADFINIRCWRKLAELVANNLSKGRLVAVSGSIQTGKYTAQDGTTKYTTEVVADEVKFLDRGNKEGASPFREPSAGGQGQHGADADFFPVEGDDDIPF